MPAGTGFRALETPSQKWSARREHPVSVTAAETKAPANSGPIRMPSGTLRNRQNAWWAREDSNLQPDRYERSALTIELRARASLLSMRACDAQRHPLLPESRLR